MERRNTNALGGLIMIILGIMCIILRGGIISIAAWCAGIALIAFGILYLFSMMPLVGVIDILLGVCIMVGGRFMVSVILYVIAIVIILAGARRIYDYMKTKAVNDSVFSMETVQGVIIILLGVIFLFNQRGTVSLAFIIAGILLIASGIIAIMEQKRG